MCCIFQKKKKKYKNRFKPSCLVHFQASIQLITHNCTKKKKKTTKVNFINHQKEKNNNKQTRAQTVVSLSLSPLPAPIFNVCQLIMTRIVNSCCISSNSKIMSHSFRLCGRRRRRIRHRTVSWKRSFVFSYSKGFSGKLADKFWRVTKFTKIPNKREKTHRSELFAFPNISV